ncbi:MAG: hypothetical protein HYT47_01005 [Candidatus Vogelbacteria bacterium]|nr:hypothetical protein [Candidatus Vogelbacteria bacterium]
MRLDHHAYLFIGQRVALAARVRAMIDGDGDQAGETYWLERESFGIGDSRQIIERQERKSWTGKRKFFVVAATNLTLPAQQALLKVLEEPTAGTHFFLICPDERNLLPTLKSRCQIIKSQPAIESAGARERARRFLSLSQSERLNFIRGALDAEGEFSGAAELLETLELALHERLLAARTAALADALAAIRQARGYLGDRSALPKLIFEHLALTLPVL